jgi:tetratricopeptide (TPR) repeat protein
MFLLLLSLATVDRPHASPYQLNADALTHFRQGRYREAETGFQKALDAWTYADPVQFARDRAVTLLNLGTVLRIEGRYAEAEPLLAEALRTLEEQSGPRSLDCARAAGALAALYRGWARPVAAEPLAKRAWEIIGRSASATESDRTSVVLLLGSIYVDEKKDVEAEALARGVEARLGAQLYNDLAAAEIRGDNLDRAERFATRAVDLTTSALPEIHPVRAAALNNLGQVRRFQGRYLEAEQNYHAAIEVWERAVGPRHPDTAKGLLNLAALNHERGREAAAEELYRRAAAIFAQAYGETNELTLVARAELAEVLRAERRYRESARLSETTLPALQSQLGASDPRVVRAFGNYQRLVEESKR